MKTKHLFYSLALSAAFAACSQEEIVSQQGAANTDLESRPVVGNVTLDFGGVESRGTIAEDGEFNSIEFVKGEDGFGARIIDAYTPSPYYATFGDHPYRNYTPTAYASSNYKYVNAGGKAWETDALMVEGNYMFYYPYSGINLARTANTVYLPMLQTVSAEMPNQAIKELYEGVNPAIVGYAFLKAEGQENIVKPELNHIFSYPQFTFVNEYTESKKVGKETVDVPTAVTVTKVVVRYEDGFYKKGSIDHANFIEAFRNFELDQIKNGTTEIYAAKEKGNWAKSKSSLLKTAKTKDFVNWTAGNNAKGDIEVVFDGGLTLQPEESFSFNIVMPAAEYDDEKLKFIVYLADDKMFEIADTEEKELVVDDNNYDVLNFVPGLRYPAEEYNNLNSTNPTKKPSAGKLGTITFTDDLKIVDALAPAAIIDDIDEFEAYLNSLVDNSQWIQEVGSIDQATEAEYFVLADNDGDGVADMQIDARVVELVKKYLAKGGVNFISTMEVADADEAVALDQMTFNQVEILSGDVTVTDVDAEVVTVHGGTLTVPAEYEGVKLGKITVDGGELILNQKDFVKLGGKNFVKVTNVVVNNVEISAGKLTVNENQGLRGSNGSDYYFVMNAGELTIAANKVVEFGANAYTQITDGKIVNNGNIKLAASTGAGFTIAEDVELENNGAITGNQELNNKGYIKTSKSLAIAANNGEIEPTVETIEVTIESGEGDVNNTAAAVVTVNGGDQTVYAEIPAMKNLLGLRSYDSETALNKIIITGDWTIDNGTGKVDLKDVSTTIKTVEFKGGDLNLKNGTQTLNLNGAEVIINANTNWTGRSVDLSTVAGIRKITVNKNTAGNKYTFNIKNIKTTYEVLSSDTSVDITDGKIDSFEELVLFANNVNNGKGYLKETITLNIDIDMEGAIWEPIGGKTKFFQGTFDGNEKTISNFKVENESYAGLFGYVAGVVKNLNVKNVVLNTTKYAGGITGYSYDATISNCTVDNVKMTLVPVLQSSGKYDDGENAGGITGYANQTTISGNTIKNIVIKGRQELAGVVGCYSRPDTENYKLNNNTVNGVTITVDHAFDAYAFENDKRAGNYVGDVVGYYLLKGSKSEYTSTSNKVTNVTIN